MTAAGQKTAENFFLTGKYREQKTGVFKGKKAVRIFQGKKQPACQSRRMKRKLLWTEILVCLSEHLKEYREGTS